MDMDNHLKADVHLPFLADEDLSPSLSHNVANVGTGRRTTAFPLLSPCSEAIVTGVVPSAPIDLRTLAETPLSTPSFEIQPSFGTVSTSAILTPFAPVALPTPPLSKSPEIYDLRLPSFHELGIAAPHPDRKLPDVEAYVAATIGAGPLSKPEDPLHALSPDLARARTLLDWREVPPMEQDTRKDDDDMPLPPTDSNPPAAPFQWPPFPRTNVTTVSTTVGSRQGIPSISEPSSRASDTLPDIQTLSISNEPTTWVDGAIQVIVSNLTEAFDGHSGSVKVLSHALPCPCTPPATNGHIFHHVIRAIHGQVPPKATYWINVFHAVPGRFKLDELPRSPPTTPGPAIGGEDYFTIKVFDSAVQISDYQGDSKLLPSPQPVVMPSTINVSIVERYIPSSNTNEFSEIFSPVGSRSILLDRLAELSADNGTLLFVYPTRTGGRTFMREYLGPILDPLLRSITVTHDLSADLGISLGPMSSVEHLLEHDEARRRLQRLCENLTQKSSSMQQFHRKEARFSIAHASKQEVFLDRKVWAEHWWVKQEKPRVRDVVTRCFRRARNLRPDNHAIPTDIIQEILSGVASKSSYPEGQEPKRGVEVSVFVVKKSS